MQLDVKEEWRDHKVKLSYLVNSADKDGKLNGKATRENASTYVCLCKRFRTAPGAKMIEGHEKKKGKLVPFKRNAFVAPYELVEICIGLNGYLWYGRLIYDKHNVTRRKATKDDTWPLSEWLDKVCASIQDPEGNPNMKFMMTPKKGTLFAAKDIPHTFQFELKEKIGARVVTYINPAMFHMLEPGHYDKLSEKAKQLKFGQHTVLAPLFDDFLLYTKAFNLDTLIRLCKTGRVQSAKDLLAKGYIDPTQFSGAAGDGWCALQHAAYAGKRPMILYLINEVKVPIDARSKDGYTALHCASMNGHFEIAKFLHSKGLSIFDETVKTGGGVSPLMLMMENKHMGLVRFFIGEKSQYAKECYKGHGIRPTEMPPDMYLTLKPLPQDLLDEMKRAQDAKIKRIKEAKREEALKNADVNGKVSKNKGKGKGKGRQSNSRASSSDSRTSTAKSTSGKGAKGSQKRSPSPASKGKAKR